MCPVVTVPGDDQALGCITVLIVKRDSEHLTAEFRHMVRRTQNPADRYAAGLKVLAASYYQRPLEFDEDLTALFNQASAIASQLLAAGCCELTFEQYHQRYLLPCAVRQLAQHEPLFQATYWHNSLFNPHIPGAIKVLAFRPRWAETRADPPIPPA